MLPEISQNVCFPQFKLFQIFALLQFIAPILLLPLWDGWWSSHRCIDPYIALGIPGEGSLGGGVLPPPDPPELSGKRKDAAFGCNPASWKLLCLGGWPCQQHGLLWTEECARSFLCSPMQDDSFVMDKWFHECTQSHTGSMPKSGMYFLDTQYSDSVPDFCK